jgi:hypothetical protein
MNPYKGREAVMFDFARSARERGEHFFYVRIPGDIGPHERSKRFEDPLTHALDLMETGRITGGGSQLGEGKTIEYCGIDVVVYDRDAGLHLLTRELTLLQAPPGTTIEEYLPTRTDHPIR